MEAFVFLGMVGPWQIILIVVLILLLFGGRKIPEMMRGIGQGMKEFKNATKDDDAEGAEEDPEKKKIDKADE